MTRLKMTTPADGRGRMAGRVPPRHGVRYRVQTGSKFLMIILLPYHTTADMHVAPPRPLRIDRIRTSPRQHEPSLCRLRRAVIRMPASPKDEGSFRELFIRRP